MTVRAKMQVTSITENFGGGKIIKFTTAYNQDDIPEDRRFYSATPFGTCEMLIDNPAAIEQLKLGAYFYVDFTIAE